MLEEYIEENTFSSDRAAKVKDQHDKGPAAKPTIRTKYLSSHANGQTKFLKHSCYTFYLTSI